MISLPLPAPLSLPSPSSSSPFLLPSVYFPPRPLVSRELVSLSVEFLFFKQHGSRQSYSEAPTASTNTSTSTRLSTNTIRICTGSRAGAACILACQ